MELTKQLLEFRSVYLRAISLAWNDKEYRKELCKPNNALSVFKNSFDYTCPWNIDFTITDFGEGPFFNSLRGVYMTSPLSFDQFVIFVPRKPQVENVAEAAACYYQDNLWILQENQASDLPASPAMNDYMNLLFELRGSATPGKIDSSLLQGRGIPEASYDLGNSNTEFTSFGGVMLSALTLMWSNQVFRSQFINSDDRQREIGQTAALLKEWLDYDYPWDVDLVIKEDPDAQFLRVNSFKNIDGSSYQEALDQDSSVMARSGEKQPGAELVEDQLRWVWIRNGQLYNQPSLGLVLSFPEAPDDIANQPVALSRYNTDGPGFPFTC